MYVFHTRKAMCSYYSTFIKMLYPSKHLLVLKTSSRHVFKTSSTRLERNNFTSSKTSWRRLEDVLKTSWRRLEDAWLRQIYYSWPKRLEDVFLRQRRKTSSRRLHQDMLAGVLSIREKHCHFISQLQTHFMDFLRLLLLI